MSHALAVKEAVKVYKVALMTGHDQRTAIRAARRATDVLAQHETVVGLKVFHTMGDSDRATRQIDTEMQSIVDSVYLAMGVDPSIIRKYANIDFLDLHSLAGKDEIDEWKEIVADAAATARKSPYWNFWTSVVSPTYHDWSIFRGENDYYNLFTSWEEYEKWLERAKALREAVKARGITLQSPAPSDLTKTAPGEAMDALTSAAKEVAKTIWLVVKVLIAVIIIVGSVIIFKRYT